ncbi:hypothetical protein ENSA5_19980 [Enhygromyxa salina]|uniref:Uncharacterized protein n=1 Tax=Enhygromyxa salina TaxID=215803 RepID=A0A2S9YCU3_9BACT|nr:hypothetical protein ENSA5_19980 [Enhygromyxa salina]
MHGPDDVDDLLAAQAVARTDAHQHGLGVGPGLFDILLVHRRRLGGLGWRRLVAAADRRLVDQQARGVEVEVDQLDARARLAPVEHLEGAAHDPVELRIEGREAAAVAAEFGTKAAGRGHRAAAPRPTLIARGEVRAVGAEVGEGRAGLAGAQAEAELVGHRRELLGELAGPLGLAGPVVEVELDQRAVALTEELEVDHRVEQALGVEPAAAQLLAGGQVRQPGPEGVEGQALAERRGPVGPLVELAADRAAGVGVLGVEGVEVGPVGRKLGHDHGVVLDPKLEQAPPLRLGEVLDGVEQQQLDRQRLIPDDLGEHGLTAVEQVLHGRGHSLDVAGLEPDELGLGQAAHALDHTSQGRERGPDPLVLVVLAQRVVKAAQVRSLDPDAAVVGGVAIVEHGVVAAAALGDRARGQRRAVDGRAGGDHVAQDLLPALLLGGRQQGVLGRDRVEQRDRLGVDRARHGRELRLDPAVIEGPGAPGRPRLEPGQRLDRQRRLGRARGRRGRDRGEALRQSRGQRRRDRDGLADQVGALLGQPLLPTALVVGRHHAHAQRRRAHPVNPILRREQLDQAVGADRDQVFASVTGDVGRPAALTRITRRVEEHHEVAEGPELSRPPVDLPGHRRFPTLLLIVAAAITVLGA